MAVITWSPQAARHLKTILEHLDSVAPRFSKQFASDIITHVQNLEKFPEMGRIVPERKDPRLRELIVSQYRVVYRIQGDFIEIAFIFHGRRNFKKATNE